MPQRLRTATIAYVARPMWLPNLKRRSRNDQSSVRRFARQSPRRAKVPGARVRLQESTFETALNSGCSREGTKTTSHASSEQEDHMAEEEDEFALRLGRAA